MYIIMLQIRESQIINMRAVKLRFLVVSPFKNISYVPKSYGIIIVVRHDGVFKCKFS